MPSDEAMKAARDRFPCCKCIECTGEIAALIEERDRLDEALQRFYRVAADYGAMDQGVEVDSIEYARLAFADNVDLRRQLAEAEGLKEYHRESASREHEKRCEAERRLAEAHEAMREALTCLRIGAYPGAIRALRAALPAREEE